MKCLFLLLSTFCSLLVYSQTQVIQNINLIDVKTGKVVPGMSVVITGQTITQVGPAKSIKTIVGATVLNGEGKFLMPGLIDSHIHFFQSGGLYTRPDAVRFDFMPYEKEKEFVRSITPDHLTRYLRLGITTVADVGGPRWNFTVRDSISKTLPSPNVYVTGPLFSMVSREALGKTDPPIIKITSTAQADSLFNKMLPFKPDFIKIWYIASPQLPAEKNFELVKYIAAQTHKNNLKLCVHATQLKTAELAVDAGADILVHSVSDFVIPDAFVKKLKDRNVTYIPTLIVSKGYNKTFARRLDHYPQDLAWANPFAYGSLSDLEKITNDNWPPVVKRLSKEGIPKTERQADSVQSINLKKLMGAGVNVASGTDAGNIGTLHASSYLQELQAMSKAGLSNAEILKASTLNPAIGFGWANRLGSIDKNMLADMIVLDQNPLEKIDHLNTVVYVIKSGKLMKADTILKESAEALVQRQVNAYNARNIDAFLDTYSDDVELYNFPNQLISNGKDQMKKRYENFFTATPNLYCEIVTRMLIGNKVIDQEKVRAGKETLRAAAVYEIQNGKIKKVTFVRP